MPHVHVLPPSFICCLKMFQISETIQKLFCALNCFSFPVSFRKPIIRRPLDHVLEFDMCQTETYKMHTTKHNIQMCQWDNCLIAESYILCQWVHTECSPSGFLSNKSIGLTAVKRSEPESNQ